MSSRSVHDPIIFTLPLEVFSVTLSLIQPDHLSHLFQLEKLPHHISHNDPYLPIRHLALYHYYSNSKVVISNTRYNKPGSVRLSYPELRYLFDNNIIIQPKEISFILDNNYAPTPHEFFNYISIFNDPQFIQNLRAFTNQFNIELILNTKNNIQNNLLVNKMFQCLGGSGHNKTFNMKIHYYGFPNQNRSQDSSQYFNHDRNIFHNQITSVENGHIMEAGELEHAQPGVELSSNYFNFIDMHVNNLALQNFQPNDLVRYLTHNSLNFQNLQKLNLSFNALSDLSTVIFPPSLTHLNLSNNYFINLDSSNFKWKSLVNLRELDLSNNNLLSIDLTDRAAIFDKNFELQTLNLSCNNLIDVSFLSTSPFFASVKSLDLSRNLISNLEKFPTNIVELNLSGNYLSNFFHQLTGKIFPKGLIDLNLSWCKINFGSYSNTSIHDTSLLLVSNIIKLEELYNLRVLRFSGNHFQSDTSCLVF